MVLESTVSVAKPGVNSVRATVPEGIVDFLELKAGDKILWKMEIVNDERVAVVTKKKGDSKETVNLAHHAMQQKRAKSS
jgi:hypothetical protein